MLVRWQGTEEKMENLVGRWAWEGTLRKAVGAGAGGLRGEVGLAAESRDQQGELSRGHRSG